MVEKKYKVMIIRVEGPDCSIAMEETYIPIGVVNAADGPYVCVLVPLDEAEKLTDNLRFTDSTKLADETEKG